MTDLIARHDFEVLRSIPFSQTLTAFYQAAITTRCPIAIWRAPHQAVKQALVDLSGRAETAKVDFQQHNQGFAFAPFLNEQGRSTRFLKASILLAQTALFEYTSPPWVTADKTRFLTLFRQYLRDYALNIFDWSLVPTSTNQPLIATETEFCALVEQAVDYIQASGIQKVVASRATTVPLPLQLSPVMIFERLCERYPHAFVSLVSIPEVGTWIGASPEILLSLNTERLHTIALAGTQAFSPNQALEDLTWGTKEIEEQALVSDYIRVFLSSLDLPAFHESGPHTVSAGNVAHLRSDFQVRINADPSITQDSLRRLANQILDKLHPTSAVCGMPKQEALSFILAREHYNRAFYSGFLGPVHIQNQSQLFVNLRCMELKVDQAILYVGAGITKDSVPALEWQETIWKSKTLLPVLEVSNAFEPQLAPAW